MLDRTRLPAAPRAERHPQTSTRHGVTLTDDYAWLRADNWRDVMRDPSVLDPAIRGYLEAENAYMAAALAHTGIGATKSLQDALCLARLGQEHDEWPDLLAA